MSLQYLLGSRDFLPAFEQQINVLLLVPRQIPNHLQQQEMSPPHQCLHRGCALITDIAGVLVEFPLSVHQVLHQFVLLGFVVVVEVEGDRREVVEEALCGEGGDVCEVRVDQQTAEVLFLEVADCLNILF